jgi:hypothetical protein
MNKSVLKYLYLLSICITSVQNIFSEEIFYKSNELGMIFDEVDSISDYNPGSEPEYFLGIESGGGIERRRLFSTEDSRFIKTWEIYYYYHGIKHYELEYSDDELVFKRVYLENGTVSEEINYETGVEFEYSFFTFNLNNQLVSLNVYDKENELIYKESYAYTESGMLRELIHTDSSGIISIYTYNFGNGVLIEEITKEEEYLYISRFSSDGKLLLNEEWKNSEIMSRSEREYDPGTGKLETVVTEDFILNTRTLQTYNDEGRLINEVSNNDEAKKYFHDDEGRVVRIRKNSLTGIEEWEYEYGDDDEISKETYSFQGRIIKVIIYTDDDTRYEEIYRQGRPFLRVYYENEEKIREELIIEQ